MKTKILLFLFLCLPVVAFSQASLPLIPNSATYDGVNLSGSSYVLQKLPNVQLGKLYYDGGRGFVKFDLSSITFSDQNMLHSAYLAFTCGGSSGNAIRALDIGKPSITDIVNSTTPNQYLVYYSQLGDMSTKLGAGYLAPNETTEVSIVLKAITDYRYANPPQPIPISYKPEFWLSDQFSPSQHLCHRLFIRSHLESRQVANPKNGIN